MPRVQPPETLVVSKDYAAAGAILAGLGGLSCHWVLLQLGSVLTSMARVTIGYYHFQHVRGPTVAHVAVSIQAKMLSHLRLYHCQGPTASC